jgi:hypothetical protein
MVRFCVGVVVSCLNVWDGCVLNVCASIETNTQHPAPTHPTPPPKFPKSQNPQTQVPGLLLPLHVLRHRLRAGHRGRLPLHAVRPDGVQHHRPRLLHHVGHDLYPLGRPALLAAALGADAVQQGV